MKSQSSQKVIQIGSSIGITIPASEARYHNIKQGHNVQLVIESSKGPIVLRIFRRSWWQRLFRG